MTRRAVLLDRDGTLNARPAPHQYVRSAEPFVWLPGAREALARLAGAGFLLAVVSNQRGVARGVVTPQTLDDIERRIDADLRAFGCRISSFRYCPHEIADDCTCRKPRPGMLLDLARELSFDLARSWVIGDSDTDVLAGHAAGCRTALVGATPSVSEPDIVAPSIAAAGEIIVAN
jgi:D-glycero-D-manno-heptose 1,7-bisphosphate phosphatase